MELYTLNPADKYRRAELVEGYETLVWTERWNKAADFVLTVKASDVTRLKLGRGTFLGLEESDRIMRVDSIYEEKGIFKITGEDLTGQTRHKAVRKDSPYAGEASNPFPRHELTAWLFGNFPGGTVSYGDVMRDLLWQVFGYDFSDNVTPGHWIDNSMQQDPNLFYTSNPVEEFRASPPLVPLYGPWPADGASSPYGADSVFRVPFGELYEQLSKLGEQWDYGFAVHRNMMFEIFPVDPTKAAIIAGAMDNVLSPLMFHVFEGRDLTSGQSTNPLVRFSAANGGLTNLKELESDANHKNVAYAFAPEKDPALHYPRGVAYAYPEAATMTSWDRRTLLVFDDVKEAPDGPALQALLNQRAADALANYNIVHMVDGEIVPQDQKYGVPKRWYGNDPSVYASLTQAQKDQLYSDYGIPQSFWATFNPYDGREGDFYLGDIVELEGRTGNLQNVRITEWIRSKDKTGERAYPTVSIIE